MNDTHQQFLMRLKIVLFALLTLCSTMAEASFFPFLTDLRAAVIDRQVAISNAPPISPAGKKELGALKKALATIDKPSSGLKTDLASLASLVSGLTRGASNEVIGLECRTAVSNYLGLLIATNDTLTAALTNANNNPALKARAVALRDAALIALAGVNPEADLNGAAKALGVVLKKYLAATKAVLAAVNAAPVPLPAPKPGKLVLEVNGMLLTYGAEFPLRNGSATGMVGTGAGVGSYSTLVVHIPSSAGPGTYRWGLIIQDTVNGQAFNFAAGGESASVTSASASVLAGTIEGVAIVTIGGTSTADVPFKCRFNGRKLSFGL